MMTLLGVLTWLKSWSWLVLMVMLEQRFWLVQLESMCMAPAEAQVWWWSTDWSLMTL